MVSGIPSKMRWLALMMFALLALAACGNADVVQLAPQSALPEFVSASPPRVQEAYRFAIANQDELAHYPCYCGCNTMGHTSNLSCYISDVAQDGTIAFDNHSVGCGICVDITQDVMRLKRDGRSPQEIRAFIDATYSAFGPSTDTPYP